ncbi:hypothetical protein I316_02292 [Kwoniella heveanensis BCC8398]|uniref:Uncharacterized protein n=1 Tax=Kwoniella heveanensis BCC8398 TaxID=1296120 RepID=A0A1B9GXQ4_9TREE|nr:hypothetical protein I316_02292 [Kwoniella heveanensis BCC8398]
MSSPSNHPQASQSSPVKNSKVKYKPGQLVFLPRDQNATVLLEILALEKAAKEANEGPNKKALERAATLA